MLSLTQKTLFNFIFILQRQIETKDWKFRIGMEVGEWK